MGICGTLVCCRTKGGSLCCALFSLSGVTFMLYIKTLLAFQPRYIHGITPEMHDGDTKSGNEIALGNTTNVAILYTVVMLISTGFFFYHKKKDAEKARYGSRQQTTSDAAAGTGPGGAELTLPDEQGVRMAELIERNVDTSSTQQHVDTSVVGGSAGTNSGLPNGHSSPAESTNLLDLS